MQGDLRAELAEFSGQIIDALAMGVGLWHTWPEGCLRRHVGEGGVGGEVDLGQFGRYVGLRLRQWFVAACAGSQCQR